MTHIRQFASEYIDLVENEHMMDVRGEKSEVMLITLEIGDPLFSSDRWPPMSNICILRSG